MLGERGSRYSSMDNFDYEYQSLELVSRDPEWPLPIFEDYPATDMDTSSVSDTASSSDTMYTIARDQVGPQHPSTALEAVLEITQQVGLKQNRDMYI